MDRLEVVKEKKKIPKLTGLVYVGQGSSLHDIPARNLTKEEIEYLGLNSRDLIKSGLYKKEK